MTRAPDDPGRPRRGRIAGWALLLALAVCGPSLAAPRGVLLLYDERPSLPGLAVLDGGLRRALTEGPPGEVEVYNEALDLSRFGSPAHPDRFADYLRAKYADGRIDVVVAVMGPSLDFLLARRDDLFQGVPIVFCGIDRRDLAARELPPGVTGVLLRREFAPTVEMALALQPDTRRAVIVGGASPFDVAIRSQLRAELQAFAGRLEIVDLSAHPFADVLDRVAALPPHTIVLFASLFRDADGEPFVPHEALERLSAAANAPVYGFVDQYLGRGMVGGRLYSLEHHGVAAAALALELLAGASPAGLPPIESSSSVLRFDGRALRRWNLPRRRLPAGAEVLYREKTLWEDFRREVLAAAAIFALLSTLLVALVLQGLRRRRAEAGLRESELRLRTLADSPPVLLWLSDPQGRLTFVNRTWLELAGSTHEAESGRRWRERVHPEDLARVPRIASAPPPRDLVQSVECRLRQTDGEYRWFLITQAPRFDSAGEFVGHVASGMDLSALKEADREAQRSRAGLAHVSRLAAMGVISAAVAHELKQPLTAILTNAEAGRLMLDAPSPDLVELRAVLRDIRDDDRRAGEIIDRMRGLLARHELRKAPMALNEAASEVLRLLDLEASERGVDLRFEPAPDLPPIAGDRVHLQQVLMNLVLNAFEAMAALPSARRAVHVQTRRIDGAGVELVVADLGPGIPPGQLPQLFEPFWTTKASGLGVGLSISRSIVESHGGRIWAENAEEGGARFHVELPADAGNGDPSLRSG